jgi:5'-deoxynucleotidase YfbR-like HD superfamily hydrolase
MAEEKYKRENAGLEKLIKDLSPKLKNEIKGLWLEHENRLTPEGRFFRHIDRIESFLQAAEYWKVGKKPNLKSFWIQAGELHDDPVLLEFIEQIGSEFNKPKK